MSCGNLDLTPSRLTIKKQLDDTLNFSVTVTDTSGTAIDLSGASAIDYYYDDDIIADLDAGVTLSGASDNIINVEVDIPTEVVGTKDHKLVITEGGVVRTYIDGTVKTVE